jgi:hypothetical protein
MNHVNKVLEGIIKQFGENMELNKSRLESIRNYLTASESEKVSDIFTMILKHSNY